MEYQIHWQHRNQANYSGHGIVTYTYKVTKNICDDYNKLLPDIIHWPYPEIDPSAGEWRSLPDEERLSIVEAELEVYAIIKRQQYTDALKDEQLRGLD